MSARKKRSPVARHRARITQKGLVRVEVNVKKEDAGLVRGVAAALADPARQEGARLLLRRNFGDARLKGLKALLASAPLEDIDLSRTRDTGRAVDL